MSKPNELGYLKMSPDPCNALLGSLGTPPAPIVICLSFVEYLNAKYDGYNAGHTFPLNIAHNVSLDSTWNNLNE